MTIVTLTIDPGTFGTAFPSRVAAALGFHLLDLTSVERRVADFGWAEDGVIHGFMNAEQPAINKWPMTIDQFSYRLKELALSEAASGDVVIAGWAAARILHAMGIGTRLHLTSSLGHRSHQISRQLAYNGIGPAIIEIDHIDHALRHYLSTAFPMLGSSHDLFDQVIVADGLAEADCVSQISDCILAAKRASKRKETVQTRISEHLDALHAEEIPGEVNVRPSLESQ